MGCTQKKGCLFDPSVKGIRGDLDSVTDCSGATLSFWILDFRFWIIPNLEFLLFGNVSVVFLGSMGVT